MPSHVLRAAVVVAALSSLSAAAVPLSLEQALVLAVDRSEAARAARAGVASAGQAAVAFAQLPDPMLRTGIENMPVTGADRFNTSSDSMTMKRIGISQEWLSQEKRSARQAAAEAAVHRETVQARAAAADARLQTALAYLDAWYAGEALKLATLTEHHVHQELEGSLARLSASTGGSPEVLALTTARGVAEDETAEVRQQQSAARLALQRWVGVPGDELVPVAQLPVPSEQAFVEASPAVLALRSEIAAARQSAALAATERKPNVTWELAYGQRSGYSDMVSLGVSIPLPVAAADRQDRETAAKLALVDKAEAELGEATREATAEYRVLASDAQRLHERIERYQASVLTPAQQRTAATTAAYRSNQATFASLFEALHAEVDLRRKQLNLQRELAKTQARLAFKPLTSEAAP